MNRRTIFFLVLLVTWISTVCNGFAQESSSFARLRKEFGDILSGRQWSDEVKGLLSELETRTFEYGQKAAQCQLENEFMNEQLVIFEDSIVFVNKLVSGLEITVNNQKQIIHDNQKLIDRLDAEINDCKQESDSLKFELIKCQDRLDSVLVALSATKDSVVLTRDTLKDVRQQLYNTQAECATESFRIVGHYKSWGRKYQVTLNRPAGESTNPHPRKLSKVTVEFNTCNADYSAVVKCTLGNKVVHGESINGGKYNGKIPKLKNKGKNWYQKGKSYQFVITESSHGKDEMEVLNKHLQNNASVRF